MAKLHGSDELAIYCRAGHLIRAVLSRKEVISSVLGSLSPAELYQVAERIHEFADFQQKREKKILAGENALKPHHENIDPELLSRNVLESLSGLSEVESSVYVNKPKDPLSIPRFRKDGVTWGGHGRRPAVFKDLTLVELEAHRVNYLEELSS